MVSVLVPLYNEEDFVCAMLERVIAAPLPAGLGREIIVVDDGSTDSSAALVEEMARSYPGLIRLFRSGRNQGKGAAICRALAEAQGEFCLIQDADLEYDPRDYMQLLEPLVEGEADVVYGSRFASASRRRVLYYWHAVANRLLTLLCNIASDLNLTDMETCYKAFRTSFLKSIPIRSKRFGIEPEITIKVARRQARVFEVPIRYLGRTYEEGKKIGARDALQALYVILKNWASNDLYTGDEAEILDAFSVAPNFNRWMASAIAPYVGRTVLEIGSGMGNLTRELIRGRKRYIATDLDQEHLTRLRNRLQHRTNLETAICDLSREADFAPFTESVDTVVCLNVLEHVADDFHAARNIYRTVVPNGNAIILVPHGQEIFGGLDVVLGHHRRYSRESLTELLQKAGFVVEQLIDFNRISWPVWAVKSRYLGHSSIGRGQLKLFDRLVWLWKRLDPLLPWKPNSIIAIANKPAGGPRPAAAERGDTMAVR
jgi:glycosyltransferase involved in cell wall biosynthesis